jgi:hypothetical protein
VSHPAIILRIYRQRLVDAGACHDGLALYDAIAAMAKARGDRRARKRLRVRWTPLHAVWLASAYPAWACWAEAHGIVPHLRGADLVGANLGGADLRGANLRGADLRGANLYGADLRGANLYKGGWTAQPATSAPYGADLRGANLRGANLYGADLRGADLRGANLYGADLRGANLRGANLYGADLRGANLVGANLVGANLRGAYRLHDPPAGWAADSSGYLSRKTSAS